MDPSPAWPSPMLGASARTAAVAAFAVAAALHTAWGLGSPWPMRTRRNLADTVVGGPTVPDPGACYAVAGLSTAAGALVAGAGGRGAIARGARFTLAIGIAARGVAGGGAAAKALGLAAPSPRFTRLDNRVYRPLFLGVAAAVLVTTLEPSAT